MMISMKRLMQTYLKIILCKKKINIKNMFLFSCVLGAGCSFGSCKGHGLLKNVENLRSVVCSMVQVIVATCEDICDAVYRVCAALFFERFDHSGSVYITLDSQIHVGDDDHRWHSWFKLKMRKIMSL